MKLKLLLQSTAILFFSRSAAFEAKQKSFSFCKRSKVSSRVTSALITTTSRMASASGLPTYAFNEQQQSGESFGERLANSMQGVFEKGFENVIVIGNDCPQLTVEIINKALIKLADNDLVLGPDKRGGVYLIGMNKKLFDKNSFLLIRWQSEAVLQDMKRVFSPSSICELQTLRDANYLTDLIKIKGLLPSLHQVKVLLNTLLTAVPLMGPDLNRMATNFVFLLFALRAPPVSGRLFN